MRINNIFTEQKSHGIHGGINWSVAMKMKGANDFFFQHTERVVGSTLAATIHDTPEMMKGAFETALTKLIKSYQESGSHKKALALEANAQHTAS